MDLHTASTVPDWELVPQSSWNEHQHRAAATNGWDTPANRESAKGALLTLAGVYVATRDSLPAEILGTSLILGGRIKDIQDGRIAERTGTKSPKGAAIDATLDKIQVFGACISLARKGVLSQPETAVIAAQSALNSGTSITAKISGKELRLNHANKIGMFGYWSGFGLKLTGHIVERYNDRTGKSLRRTGSALIWASCAVNAFGSANLITQITNTEKSIKAQVPRKNTKINKSALNQLAPRTIPS